LSRQVSLEEGVVNAALDVAGGALKDKRIGNVEVMARYYQRG